MSVEFPHLSLRFATQCLRFRAFAASLSILRMHCPDVHVCCTYPPLFYAIIFFSSTSADVAAPHCPIDQHCFPDIQFAQIFEILVTQRDVGPLGDTTTIFSRPQQTMWPRTHFPFFTAVFTKIKYNQLQKSHFCLKFRKQGLERFTYWPGPPRTHFLFCRFWFYLRFFWSFSRWRFLTTSKDIKPRCNNNLYFQICLARFECFTHWSTDCPKLIYSIF